MASCFPEYQSSGELKAEDRVIDDLKNVLHRSVISMTQPSGDRWYWSRRFRRAKSISEANETLCRLFDDFVTYWNQYAKRIVHELSLPFQLKSIPSVDVGGVAGGSKFIAC